MEDKGRSNGVKEARRMIDTREKHEREAKGWEEEKEASRKLIRENIFFLDLNFASWNYHTEMMIVE